MNVHFLIHRRGFTVTNGQHGAALDNAPPAIGAQSRLPMFVASLWLHQDNSTKGVTFDQLQSTLPYRGLSKHPESLVRRIDRHLGDLKANLGTWSHYLGIEQDGERERARFWLRATAATIEIAKDVHAQISQKAPHKDWIYLPRHEESELQDFAEAIANAAASFDKNDAEATAKTLVEAIRKTREPRYLAVLHFRLARVNLRAGNNNDAKVHIETASRLVEEEMDPPDEILRSRVHYNRAWLAYMQGDSADLLIKVAQESLAAAAPDDIRSGYVATQRGLVLIKGLERSRRLSNEDRFNQASDALANLTHAVYLLARSEDFWGLQESCANVVAGRLSIGKHGAGVGSRLVGEASANLLKAARWLKVSDAIAKGHGTGNASLANLILKAEVALQRAASYDALPTRSQIAEDQYRNALGQAGHLLRQASKKVNDSTSPRELGLLHKCRINYFLHRGAQYPNRRKSYDAHAMAAFTAVEEAWGKHMDLIRHELHADFKRGDKRVVRVLKRKL